MTQIDDRLYSGLLLESPLHRAQETTHERPGYLLPQKDYHRFEGEPGSLSEGFLPAHRGIPSCIYHICGVPRGLAAALTALSPSINKAYIASIKTAGAPV